MHRTIYQIMFAPISRDEHICESDFFDHWFTKSIAGNVSEDVNRDVLIASFQKWLENFGSCKFDEKSASFTLYAGFHESYFKHKYERFKKEIASFEKITLQEFCHDHSRIDSLLSNLQSAFSESFEDYVSSDEFGPITMDEFLRTAEIGTSYFIGGVLDYHC